MKPLIRIAFVTLLSLYFFGVAAAQDEAKDTVRFAGTYNRTDFPYARTGLGMGEYSHTENVNGYTVEADVKVFKAGGLRGSLAYNFKQMYNVEVFPLYYDPLRAMVFDLYRNVQTHSGLAQLGYTVKGAFEPFAALGYGGRRLHEDTPRQTLRLVRLGVNIPFHEKSPFFIKGYVDFEQPYGELPMGFVNPDTRTLSFGAGVRF